MYLDVAEHDIEPAVSSPFFRNPVCLDYLLVSRDFGEERTCGRMPPTMGLEPNRLLFEFRSNRRVRFPGFRLRVVCFNPIQQDGSGCTLMGPRGRRDVPSKARERIVPREASRMPREARTRFVQEDIPRDAEVLYSQREVTVKAANHSVLLWFPHVNNFTTYNDFDRVTVYGPEDRSLSFRGFGESKKSPARQVQQCMHAWFHFMQKDR